MGNENLKKCAPKPNSRTHAAWELCVDVLAKNEVLFKGLQTGEVRGSLNKFVECVANYVAAKIIMGERNANQFSEHLRDGYFGRTAEQACLSWYNSQDGELRGYIDTRERKFAACKSVSARLKLAPMIVGAKLVRALREQRFTNRPLILDELLPAAPAPACEVDEIAHAIERLTALEPFAAPSDLPGVHRGLAMLKEKMNSLKAPASIAAPIERETIERSTEALTFTEALYRDQLAYLARETERGRAAQAARDAAQARLDAQRAERERGTRGDRVALLVKFGEGEIGRVMKSYPNRYKEMAALTQDASLTTFENIEAAITNTGNWLKVLRKELNPDGEREIIIAIHAERLERLERRKRYFQSRGMLQA